MRKLRHKEATHLIRDTVPRSEPTLVIVANKRCGTSAWLVSKKQEVAHLRYTVGCEMKSRLWETLLVPQFPHL